MTRKDLQDALVKETKELLKDVWAKNSLGEDVQAQVFPQRLPVMTEDEDDETKLFPYAIVRLGDAKTAGDEDPWHVTVDWLLGVYDDERKGQGHLHILTMIERITDRFIAEPLLDHRYRAEQDMETVLQDEDTYPFYFGGVEITFSIPKVGRRDEYA